MHLNGEFFAEVTQKARYCLRFCSLLYIEGLRSVVSETVKVALFADDISLISSHQ